MTAGKPRMRPAAETTGGGVRCPGQHRARLGGLLLAGARLGSEPAAGLIRPVTTSRATTPSASTGRGEQTERLDGPGGHGGAGKVCIMPDHHRSGVAGARGVSLFHLYFTPAHFTASPSRCATRRGATCNWKTRPSSRIPRRRPWCRAADAAGLGSTGIDRMALSHGALDADVARLHRHHTREAPPCPGAGCLAPAVVRRVRSI